MEPIDRAAIMGALTSSEGQTAIRAMTGMEAYNYFLSLLCSVPAIDPIRAAGGCRCGECSFKDTFDCPAAKNGYTFSAMEHCSYGEPREAQDDAH